MESTPADKQRSTRRCREWERQRRLKFNNAISKLGEVVKAINKTNSNTGDSADDDAQYPKIEIVQKAIICLTNCVQEKTQLKAEILALEVKLEAIEKKKHNRRDVSLQVMIGKDKRGSNTKCVKLMMVPKDEQTTVKEKIIKASSKPKIRDKLQSKNTYKLPKLLPLSNVKKDNTIVMLPAAPYIFQQRPVLFPTGPPTIVLVDANLQSVTRPTPNTVINRSTHDITKTTMVNVLPISAYSRPLSASKNKKSNAKPRNNVNKKVTIKCKSKEKSEDPIKINTETEGVSEECITDHKTNVTASNGDNNGVKLIELDKECKLQNTNNLEKSNIQDKPENNNESNLNNFSDEKTLNQTNDLKTTTTAKCLDIVKSTPVADDKNEILLNQDPITKTTPDSSVSNVDNHKCSKDTLEKPITCDDKSKENKLQTILDPAICENVVDGGNVRLELAEEFLAASPTAAFLMSFPLVSGNRADSPADETHATPHSVTKNTNQRIETPSQAVPYFEKHSSPISKVKNIGKTDVSNTIRNKSVEHDKYHQINKQNIVKTPNTSAPNICNDNPFLNLPITTTASSSCSLGDTSFGLEFDCNISKAITTQSTNFVTNNNLFYKSDPLSTVKSTIYSTSNISSGHEFNSLGLYPCAVDNYTTKNKTEFNSTEDNIMKMNSSRLTYDIDLGWSHKSFDFVNCSTTANTFHKDNMLNTTAPPYSTAYNPFNPEFHVPLVPNTNKRNISHSKPSSFPDAIASFYSQNTSLWPDDIPNIYTHSNVSKNFAIKQQNYLPVDQHIHNLNSKTNSTKHYDTKHDITPENILKTPTLTAQHMPDKFTKKSPNKMHINWMTSEVRPMQNNCNQTPTETKQSIKLPYVQTDHSSKKQTQSDGSYLPINMQQFPTQSHNEELHVWPAPRPAGTTEISIEPPPINLPTLVGDLALGPHDRKKNDLLNRVQPQTDLQNCSNFFSVTQLMNRSSENIPSRTNIPIGEISKLPIPTKQNSNTNANESNRKSMTSRIESHPQLCYSFNDAKVTNSFDNMNEFSQNKSKSNKADKNSKVQKNNYSAEALIRGGTCSQKIPESNTSKYLVASQKYNEFNISQDTGVAQVSHFPPILDYTENNYAGQQFSGTTLYNPTTNTISNSFYSNFMPGSSNLMSNTYTSGPFTSEIVDYNQTNECNYTNHKYPDMKMRSNGTTYQQDKEPSSYKNTRRESTAKHKLECSKKEANKKYQSKRAKLNEVEEWNDPSQILWQNKNPSKRHPNIIPDEPPFTNYVGNQMATQYQPEYFNSHLVPTNIQNIGSNGERSSSNFPVASRANFNLSALFPEITMKVQ